MPHIVGRRSLMSNAPWWGEIFVSNPLPNPHFSLRGGVVGQHNDRCIKCLSGPHASLLNGKSYCGLYFSLVNERFHFNSKKGHFDVAFVSLLPDVQLHESQSLEL